MNDKNFLREAAASALMPGQPGPTHRILVVDDEPLIRQLNTEVLINYGYEVDAAENGEVAWQALNSDIYDLLVTDNDMPKMTGIDLLKRLHAARMDLPTIMVTATFPKEEFLRHPWILPNASLLKPYTLALLLGTVREVLRATDGAREQTAPPPHWQDQPLPNRLQL